MMGLGIAAASGLLMLAGGPMKCAVNTAPVISVKPESAAVRYDFSKTAAELTAMKSNTVSPYAPGTETITQGLRADRPVIQASVGAKALISQDRGIFCMTYGQIDISIKLAPVIYVAKERPSGGCRNAILDHEKKHVRVDREMMNKYARRIGEAVQKAVNEVGVVGPMNLDKQQEARDFMTRHIESAIQSMELPLYNEMRARQGEIDSLEEYQRVNWFCKGQ